MASQSQGIQQLLAAEKRAAEKVAEARKSKNFARQNKKLIFFIKLLGKQRRLKQAKEEAHEEIERYQKEREKQFKEFEAKVIEFMIKFIIT